jgi:co-chaperonin GroES (HSP10)
METTMTETAKTEADLEQQLPKPVGYKLLIALPEVEDTFAGGILKADTTKHQEQILTVVGAVLDMGEQAYSDKDRFPNGPWCKVGDFVVFRANTGTRIKVNGVETRLINDDSVEAVVADPRGVSRA